MSHNGMMHDITLSTLAVAVLGVAAFLPEILRDFALISGIAFYTVELIHRIKYWKNCK